MADDEKSTFSEWESVKADASTAVSRKNTTNNNDEDDDDNSVMTTPSEAQIWVELPPGGILGPQDREESGSSTSFSMVRKIDGLNLRSTSVGSSTGVAESSYAISKTTAQEGGGRGSFSDTSSMVSYFEIVSIYGEMMLHCKRCKVNNPDNAKICGTCGLALVPNPDMSIDQQIALHLQQKEEEDARGILREEELKQQRLMEDPMYASAIALSGDILAVVSKRVSAGFRALSEADLTNLAVGFLRLTNSALNPKISFAYKFTSKSKYGAIKSGGFPSMYDHAVGGFGAATPIHPVDVYRRIEEAWDTFRDTEMVRLGKANNLYSIPEGADDCSVEALEGGSYCWVVAFVDLPGTAQEYAMMLPDADRKRAALDADSSMKILPNPAQVLPVAYFEAGMRDCAFADIKTLSTDLKGAFDQSFTSVEELLLPSIFKKLKTNTKTDKSDPNPSLLSETLSETKAVEKPPLTKEAKRTVNVLPVEELRDDNGGLFLKVSNPVWSVAVSPLGTLVLGCENKKIFLWSNVHGGHYSTLEGHLGYINCFAFAPPGAAGESERFVAGDSTGAVKMWDTSPFNTQPLTTLDHKDKKPILDLRFFPSGKTLAVANWDRGCQLWRMVDETCICSLQGSRPEKRDDIYGPDEDFFLQSAAFSPNVQSLVSAAYGSSYIFRWDFNKSTEKLYGHKTAKDVMDRDLCLIRTMTYSPDGSLIASAGNDQTIRFWKPDETESTLTIEFSPMAIYCLAFSPDGKIIAGGCSDFTVRLWSVENGEALQTFSGHKGAVKAIAFFPDGKTLVSSGGVDNTIRFWDVSGMV